MNKNLNEGENMIDTKEMYERKGFDEKTIELVNNFLYEFDELYGKYLPQEEVLERINDYLDKVSFVEKLNGKAVGCYNGKTKEICIDENHEDEEVRKEVFFHEMIHVLRQKIKESNKEAYDNLHKKGVYDDFLLDEDEKYDTIFSFYDAVSSLDNPGMDEGFTQYLTTERHKKFGSGEFKHRVSNFNRAVRNGN